MSTDPVKQIMMALADARKLQDSAATEEIYNRLRSLLQQDSVRNSDAIYVLDRYREKPDIWEAPLKDELRETSVEQDEKILQMAEQLISLEHTQQQAIFERIIAESALVCTTLQKSNRHFRDHFEGRYRFGIFIACFGLLSLLMAIFILSRGDMHLAPSILITTFIVEALSLLFFLQAKNVDMYTERNNEQLLQAEAIHQKIEFVSNTDGEIRRHLSHLIVDQLLKLAS